MGNREIQKLVSSDPFERAVMFALVEISAVDATRREYRRDFELWRAFCGEVGVSLTAPQDGAVSAWVEWMRARNHASKSRARRMSALSSIYRELRRKKIVDGNPFSADEGPRREKVSVEEPTQIATPEMVRALLAACDETPLGLRDAAIIRVLWSTGMRRVSLLSMTSERLQKDHMGYVATVIKKGGDNQRVLICGKARDALDRWIEVLREGGLASGPIWRARSGKPLELRELNRAISRRGAGVSPHMLRVAFLTYNPAGLEAKQDAAGHSDPATTRLYDRDAWRGRAAFEQMPEIEEVK